MQVLSRQLLLNARVRGQALARQLGTKAARSVVCARERRASKFDSSSRASSGRVIGEAHAARSILDHSSLRVTRQLEMLNVLLGFEQANRYALVDPQGNAAGFMVEEETATSVFSRQVYGKHRPFSILVLDPSGNACLRIRRAFSLVNSYVTVEDVATGEAVGESQQEWHVWRRKYSLFRSQPGSEMAQFARIDVPFLSWDFPMADEQGAVVGGVFRDFSGIGTELLTDYGLYAVCFDRLSLAQRVSSMATTNTVQPTMHAMDLDCRAAALAAAVSIDFDYFSRHSRLGMGASPWFFFPMSSGYAPPSDSDS
ncbi:hypothetical protein H4R23_000714 [Coemansia sp. Cherry 401B]|nr:hypothetical protein H4R23_000714 [Coemansia sp. Cherry 401B]